MRNEERKTERERRGKGGNPKGNEEVERGRIEIEHATQTDPKTKEEEKNLIFLGK